MSLHLGRSVTASTTTAVLGVRTIAFVRLSHGATSIALVDIDTERVTPLVRR